MADTSKTFTRTTTGLHYDLSKININKSIHELIDDGKKIRDRISFDQLGKFVPVKRNVVEGISHVEEKMIGDLMPLRHKRLAASAFAFFRGTDELMAFDLSKQTSTNIPVVISGDAHLGNFGFYASPERKLLFDPQRLRRIHHRLVGLGPPAPACQHCPPRRTAGTRQRPN